MIILLFILISAAFCNAAESSRPKESHNAKAASIYYALAIAFAVFAVANLLHTP